jgi:site-specific recombinase XerC
VSYADRNRRPPKTLSDAEVDRLLKVSGRDRDGFRDHVIFSLALGCGLRESEIVALSRGDVLTKAGNVRRVIELRVFKGSRRENAETQFVHLPESAFYKLEKLAAVERLDRAAADAPVFVSRKGNRLSSRAVRSLFWKWQQAAGFERRYKFHALRHTAVSNVRRATGDLRLTQLFARHANVQTTTIYAHVRDDELAAAVAGLRC